jgi:hypothetical protein
MWRVRYLFVAVLNTLAVVALAYSLVLVQVKRSGEPQVAANSPNPAKIETRDFNPAEVLVSR